VKESVAAFTRLAKNHTDFVRSSTADRMNLHGYPKTYVVGDIVKIRVPPTHEQMLICGRRSSHFIFYGLLHNSFYVYSKIALLKFLRI
jgi:hypothetical protein